MADKVKAEATQRSDADEKAVKENTKSLDTTKQESGVAPNSNKASDKNQGNKGTEDANAPGVNQKSTPGMDSDASSSMSLGTTTAAPSDNESVAEAAARTNRIDDKAPDATYNNSPDANHSFRGHKEGNDYLDESVSKDAAKEGKSKLSALKKLITEGTPDDHVLFGIGDVKFTVGDLKAAG